ncbi:MAG TPA: hypothetical protein VK919_14230 [Solirubrobacterales bacterium]|nr:hypothetical protein [Solirubrobacterales bacterium]
MSVKLVVAAVVVAIGAASVLAATAISGSGEKAAVGPPVGKAVERATAAEARIAGATIAARARRTRFSFFRATTPTVVPADGVTPITVLRCPRRQRAVAGFYRTDRAIALDYFQASGGRQWRFGFVDLAGLPGLAYEGIVCAR